MRRRRRVRPVRGRFPRRRLRGRVLAGRRAPRTGYRVGPCAPAPVPQPRPRGPPRRRPRVARGGREGEVHAAGRSGPGFPRLGFPFRTHRGSPFVAEISGVEDEVTRGRSVVPPDPDVPPQDFRGAANSCFQTRRPLSPRGAAGFGAHHAFRGVGGSRRRSSGTGKFTRSCLEPGTRGAHSVALGPAASSGRGEMASVGRGMPGVGSGRAAAGVARPSCPRSNPPFTRRVICPLTDFIFKFRYRIQSKIPHIGLYKCVICFL